MFEYYYNRNGKHQGHFHVQDRDTGQTVFADRVDLTSREQRVKLLPVLASITKEAPGAIEQKLLQLAAREEERLIAEREARRKRSEQPAASAPPGWEPSALARKEAERLLERPDLLAEIVNTINDLGVTQERPLTALAYLVATSRLLERPLYLLVQGEPSSGKSFILQTVCQTLTPGLTETITDLTPEALYYLSQSEAPLKNRVLLLGERRRQRSEESIDATKALRELHESGRLTKLVPVKEAGKLKTVRIVIEGAPAILETVSHNAIPPEDLSRTILAWTDESEAQTRQVIRDYAQRKANGGLEVTPDRLEALWAAQWLLEPHKVRIPFLPDLAEKFPAQQSEARRAFVRLAAVAEASCLLHQRQRRLEGDCLLAEEDDLRLAWRLLKPWIRVRLAEGPPPAVLRIWEAIRHRQGTLTQAELTQQGLGSKPTIRTALRYLEQAGAIAFQEAAQGRPRPFRVVNPDWIPEDLNLVD